MDEITEAELQAARDAIDRAEIGIAAAAAAKTAAINESARAHNVYNDLTYAIRSGTATLVIEEADRG